MTAIAEPELMSPPSPTSAVREMVIQPKSGWIAIDWSEMFRFRELLYFLVWRDVKVRYKQTVLGFAWALLQPLLQSMIAVLIFGTVAGFQKVLPATVPYLLFSLVGQIPWQFFNTALGTGGMSLVNQQHLLTKIYFPRLFLPTGVIGGAVFDLAVSALMVGGFMVYYHFSHWHFTPGPGLLLVPLLLVPAAIASLGVAYTLSAVTVTYRDVRFLVPVASQIWMWLSFVMLPRKLLLESHWSHYEWLLAMNPMYGVLEGIRHFTLPDMPWNPWHLVLGTAVALGMAVFGAFYFRKTERRFADIA